MTNPNNAIGTNGAYSGRTSVNAFNDNLALYTGRGILSGWATSPSSGLTVALGGDSSTRDVAIAEDNAGNKTSINNISGSPVSVTISAAPSTNSRIDLIVAYVENPPQGSSDKVDNYEACGLIVVEGTVAASPSAPSEADIRSAITADGATGSTAYYVILSSITITSGTTDLTSNMITAGGSAMIKNSSYRLDDEIEAGIWVDGRTIFKKTVNFGQWPNATAKTVAHGISNFDHIVKVEGYGFNTSTFNGQLIPYVPSNSGYMANIYVNRTDIVMSAIANLSGYDESYITLYYVKTN